MNSNMINNVKGGFNMNNKIIYTIIVLGVLIAGWYILDSNSPIVSAQGQSTIKAHPDEVSVYVSIETHNKTAQAAQDTNSQLREEVISALTKAGVPNDSIQFQQYSIYPEYDWSNNQQKQIGYVASQYLIINSSNFSTVPGIVDDIISAGGLVSSIQFELSDAQQNIYKSQALEAAGKDAQSKAAATASGLGKKLGRLVSVQTSDYNYPGPIMYYAKAATVDASGTSSSVVATPQDIVAVREAASNISPQDIEVTATLQVEYKVSWF